MELDDLLSSTTGNTRQGFYILERDTALPPSLYDIAELPYIFIDQSGYEAEVKGTYVYQKSDYIPFAVGTYIFAAITYSSSTAFANPAVAIGRIFSNANASIDPQSAFIFCVIQIFAALFAYAFCKILLSEKKVKKINKRKTR